MNRYYIFLVYGNRAHRFQIDREAFLAECGNPNIVLQWCKVVDGNLVYREINRITNMVAMTERATGDKWSRERLGRIEADWSQNYLIKE